MEFRALLLGLTLSFAVISCNNAEDSNSTTAKDSTLKTPQTTTNTTSETTTPKPSSTTSRTKGSSSTTAKDSTLKTPQTTTNATSEAKTPKPSSKLSKTRANATLSPQVILKLFKANIGFFKTDNLSAKLTEVLKELGYVKKEGVSASIKTTTNTPLNNQTTKPDSPTHHHHKSSASTLSTSTPAQNSSTPTKETAKKPPPISKGKLPGYSSPRSSHFAVVFLVMIALLFGLYALYHNRQKIIAVVVEGRSSSGGRGNRERYRKLDSGVEEPRARIKKSNEVYVY